MFKLFEIVGREDSGCVVRAQDSTAAKMLPSSSLDDTAAAFVAFGLFAGG